MSDGPTVPFDSDALRRALLGDLRVAVDWPEDPQQLVGRIWLARTALDLGLGVVLDPSSTTPPDVASHLMSADPVLDRRRLPLVWATAPGFIEIRDSRRSGVAVHIIDEPDQIEAARTLLAGPPVRSSEDPLYESMVSAGVVARIGPYLVGLAVRHVRRIWRTEHLQVDGVLRSGTSDTDPNDHRVVEPAADSWVGVTVRPTAPALQQT